MPVLLSDETYARIMKLVDAWEEGELKIIPGHGLRIEEVGPDGTKIGVFDRELNIPNFSTLNLNVCISGTPTAKTFLTVIGG